MVSKFRKSTQFSLIAILATIYLCLLYLILNPNVSQEYRNYYIERTTTLTPFEQQKAAKGLDAPVLTIRFDDPDALFSGWSAPEKAHRWSNGQSSSISFSLPANTSFKGVMILTARYLGNQQVTVALDDHVIAAFESRTAHPDLLVDIDPTLLIPGKTHRLAFDFPQARQPGNGDPRQLAMALLGIEIH